MIILASTYPVWMVWAARVISFLPLLPGAVLFAIGVRRTLATKRAAKKTLVAAGVLLIAGAVAVPYLVRALGG